MQGKYVKLSIIHRYRHQILTASLLFVILFMAGCLGSSNPTRYYVLSPIDTAPAQDKSNEPLHIEITAVRLPHYLDRAQVVIRSGNDRLHFSDNHQWGGNLRKNLIRTLSVNLSRRLNTPNVTMSPHRSADLPDYRVEVEIIKFEKDTDGKVHLSAKWRISSGHDQKIRITQTANLNTASALPDDDYDAIVASMVSLYGELSQIIATEIRNAAVS
ncbi:MAG: membrane integrity-associated transporter subunit PqiC [Gammaproteobacteria bacterium]|nr:MAG: membrane integrity-associated transporter subunit PqiC [Gammaproteobacteria bacterium]